MHSKLVVVASLSRNLLVGVLLAGLGASVAHAAPTRLWGTYYGGTGSEEAKDTTFVDGSNDVFVTGRTSSTDGIGFMAHDTTHNGLEDAFLARFDGAGTGTLAWGTYYGGTGHDEFVRIVSHGTSVYAFGSTSSSGTNVIATTGDISLAGTKDTMLVKFNDSGVRQWGTYFGGTGLLEAPGGICISDDGLKVYVVGTTDSAGLASPGAHDTSVDGNAAFIAQFSSAGVRGWTTYYGGNFLGQVSGFAVAYGCAVDSTGNVYVTGTALEADPALGTVGAHDPTHNGNSDAFLAKFNSLGVRQWGTFYGGSSDDQATNVGVDYSDDVYIVGWTSSGSGIHSTGAHDPGLSGTTDGFVAKFNPANGQRLWGTYLGGSGADSVHDVDFFGSDVHVSVETDSATGFAFGSPFDGTFGGSADAAFVVLSGSGALTYASYNGGTTYDAGRGVGVGFAYAAMTGTTNSTSGVATAGAHDTVYSGVEDVFVTYLNMFTPP